MHLPWRTRSAAATAVTVWSRAVITACRAHINLLLITFHWHIQHLTVLLITVLVLIWVAAAAAVKCVLTVCQWRRLLGPWRLWFLRPTSENHAPCLTAWRQLTPSSRPYMLWFPLLCCSSFQRCADPEIFESASVRRFWPRICCQSVSTTREEILDPRPFASALNRPASSH